MKLENQLLLRDLRKFYLHHSWTHRDVQGYLKEHYGIEISVRTLKRWRPLLRDISWTGPRKPHVRRVQKVTQGQLLRILALRKKTGWGSLILKNIFDFPLSESTYKRIIKANGFSRGSKIENKRIHWVKWQRQHPDSLWQLDASQLDDGSWRLDILDDCSRYCFVIKNFPTMTTGRVTALLEELFEVHGVPRELLTDNGSEFGGVSRDSHFDEWCEKWKIKHIRSRVHKPTTLGKVERYHLTFQQEIAFCQGDLELFRYRYNHIRPHRSLNMKTPAQVYFDLQIRLKMIEKKKREIWG